MLHEAPAALVGDNGGDPHGTLPALQDWAAAHTLALTQPAQPENGASVQTTLCDSPETPLEFVVMAITRPFAITPESSTFLLPLVPGQVETLLTTRVVLTTSTSRDLISLQRKLSACPIFSDYVIECIQWGPGGNAPIHWCHAHGITDPFSILEVHQYYYDHLLRGSLECIVDSR